MTHDEHVAACRESATKLASDVKAAADAGVPPIILLPTLLSVFREAGMMPDGMQLPMGLSA